MSYALVYALPLHDYQWFFSLAAALQAFFWAAGLVTEDPPE